MFEFLQNPWFYFALLLSVPLEWFVFLLHQLFLALMVFFVQYGLSVLNFLLIYAFDDRLLGWDWDAL